MSQFVECPQKHIDNENCDKVSKQDVNVSIPHTREEIVINSSINNVESAVNPEAVDTNEVSLESERFENVGKDCDEAIDVERVIVEALKSETNSDEFEGEDEVSKLNLECFDVRKDCDEAVDVENEELNLNLVNSENIDNDFDEVKEGEQDIKQQSKPKDSNSNEIKLESQVSKLNCFEHGKKNCNEVVDLEKVEVDVLKPDMIEFDSSKVKLEGEESKLNLESSEYFEKNCDEHVEKVTVQILPNESDSRISVIVPIESVNAENTLSSSSELIFDSKMNNVPSVEAIRRNSLPEGGRTNLNKIIVNSTSANFDNVSQVDRTPTLQSDRAKVTPNMHNISDVVRNVHGLFSIVKNAYKPMEKNIGEMVIATQKNLSSAKNGYLYMKQETKSHDVVENLSKYSTLNLSNENKDLDIGIFSKCDNLKLTDNDKKSAKNSDGKQDLNDYIDKSNSDVKRNLEVNSKQNSESDLHRKSQKQCVKMDSFSIDEETIAPCHRDQRLVYGVGTAEVTEDKRSSEGMDVLEATVLEQNAELDALRQALSQKDAIKRELEAKISNLSRQLDASVMRYAVSERTSLSVEKACADARERETRVREEAALLERRLRAAHKERTRICDMLDEKSHEVTAAQKEIARCKEEVQGCEMKLKWTQNKLMSEIEAHKEASSLAERLGHQVAQLESPHRDPASIQQSSDLDAQMKEKEASAILERHERQRLDALCKQLQVEVEQLRANLAISVLDNRELRAQVGSHAAEADALRDANSELRAHAARDCERLAQAQARAARVDTLTAHLQQEQERAARLQTELEAEKRARSEAMAECELSTRREAELLRQAERLTEAGVRLQATCSEAEAKALALSVDNASLRAAALRSAELRAASLAEAVREREGRAEDARALAAAAARSQRAERVAMQRLEQAEGDAKAMATKHASAIKELKREIQQWKRKYEKVDLDNHSVQPKPAQRTGSCSSLSSFEGSSAQQNSQTDSLEPILDVQVDRQQLVERIVQLQRAGARRSERLEFLEGHSAQLTAELQRKSRVLRAMLASAPAGALANRASDCNKMEMGRHGGIMASIFNHEVSDSTMTLELSIEMNAKLQSLLEDTLLKNITLKENMDTLGDEIARLKEDINKKPKK